MAPAIRGQQDEFVAMAFDTFGQQMGQDLDAIGLHLGHHGSAQHAVEGL